MPQFASAQGAAGMGFPLQRLWLYERVPGARLVGRTDPGAQVTAEIALQVHGQADRYRAWTRADATGRYEVVLPLPDNHLEVQLPPGSELCLDLTTQRYVNEPSYAQPF